MLIESFAFYIAILRKQFTAYCSEKLLELGVTYGQLYIIIFVGKKQQCSPKDISLALKLDAGHLNRTLSKLMENDLIIQQKNDHDKRSNIVSLTAKGKQVFERSRNLFHEWDDIILATLTNTEKQQLMNLMKKLVCEPGNR